MVRITASKARQEFAETLDLAHEGERIVLHRGEKDVAAIVSMEDLALLEALEDRMDLEAVREALKEPGSIPWEQVKADLGLS
ncbi:MAG: type II toxin-antitoxin system Phd/YefM family antitoxin [Isosphaeraceae bacterium]